MSDEGLRGTVSEFGDTAVKDAIHSRFHDQLKPPSMWGEQLGDGDVRDVSTGMRKYDHGKASNKTVSQVGVKAVFNPEKTDVQDLQEGGQIHSELTEIANTHFTCKLEEVDLTFVRDDEYVVWLIADTSSLME